MPLFGSSKKNPAEIVKILCDALQVLEKETVSSKKTDKVSLFCCLGLVQTSNLTCAKPNANSKNDIFAHMHH